MHTGQHKCLVNLEGFSGGMELAGVLKILQILAKEHGVWQTKYLCCGD